MRNTKARLLKSNGNVSTFDFKVITKLTRLAIIFLLLFIFSNRMFADTIVTFSGSEILGKISSESNSSVTIQLLSGASKVIPRNQIKSIEYNPTTQDGKNPGKTDNASASSDKPRPLFDWFKERKIHGVYGYGYLGLQSSKIDGLNNALAKAGHTNFDNSNFFSFGGGSTLEFGKMLFGMEADLSTFKKETSTANGKKYSLSLSAGSFFGRSGISVYRNSVFHFFPYVGFGISGFNLSMAQKRETKFEDALKNPAQGFIASTLSFQVLAGLEINFRFPIMQWQNGLTGVLFGLQSGYGLHIGNTKWRQGSLDKESPIINGPDDGLTGVFARVIAGGYMTF